MTGQARIAAFGDQALLVEAPPQVLDVTAWCLAAAAALRRADPEVAVTVGLASVLVVRGEAPMTDPAAARAAVHAALARLSPAAAREPGPRQHRLAAVYDGPDLPEVAAGLGLSAGALVARHRAAVWTVAALGFSPGFGYLVCDDELFMGVPRRPDPRRRVPAGSIAVAAGMCAVYPDATPGGWQLIGHCPARLFDVAADPPALLAVGDRVRFVEDP
jgi:KipI family sensor histidine kinase inhibitor